MISLALMLGWFGLEKIKFRISDYKELPLALRHPQSRLLETQRDASVRIDIRRSSQIKAGEDVIGNRTRVKIVKNKVAPPFRKAEFDIMYGKGVSKVGEIIDLAVDHDIIKKAGSWFSYGDTKLGQGRDAVKELIGDNPELMEELEQKIVEALSEK